MKLVSSNPNFSIVTPGGCNASCNFCFWRQQKQAENYIQRLDSVLRWLPEAFQECSITGGEPTLSPALWPILQAAKARFPKVILTTNGANLANCYDMLEGLAGVNISRHHWLDDNNMAVFNTHTVPARWDIENHISELQWRGVPVTLSAVLPSNATGEWVDQYVDFARDVRASQVFFRKPHGNLEPHPVEQAFTHYKGKESQCPACYSRRIIIQGMPVVFKRATSEPSNDMCGVYEAVFHPDGTLSSDWEGKNPIELVKPAARLELVMESRTPRPTYTGCGGYSSYHTGCGF